MCGSDGAFAISHQRGEQQDEDESVSQTESHAAISLSPQQV